jgi:collagen type II alpha
MGAYNTVGGTFILLLSSVIIPLQQNQILNGFVANSPTDTIFTVGNTGTYFVNYRIAFTVGLLFTSEITVNGTSQPPLAIASTIDLADFSTSAIIQLVSGNTISLVLTGTGTAILNGGVSASLNIIQLI